MIRRTSRRSRRARDKAQVGGVHSIAIVEAQPVSGEALNLGERRRSRKGRRSSAAVRRAISDFRKMASRARSAVRRSIRRRSRESVAAYAPAAERRRSRRSHRSAKEGVLVARPFMTGSETHPRRIGERTNAKETPMKNAAERRRSRRSRKSREVKAAERRRSRRSRKSREVKAAERRRSRRSRKGREVKAAERRRSRRSRRSRETVSTRERRRSRELLGAVNYGVQLAERRRSRRSRKGREVKAAERRRSRRSRRSRETAKVAERRRSRRSRRSAERRRSRRSRRSHMGAEKRRRSRRSRRSRETAKVAERRRSRRSRRSRETAISRPAYSSYAVLAERRRRSGGMRPLFGGREGFGGATRSSYSSLAERARRYAPRGREWFGAERRYSNPDGVGGVTGKLKGFADQALKPAGWGALGLVGSRMIGEGYAWMFNKVGLTGKTPRSIQPYAPIGLALLSAGTAWTILGKGWLGTSRLTPERKRYVNVGAGLLVVQELLAILLPKMGFLPVWAQRSLTGELPPSLGALPAIQQQQAALGNCFTGSCAQALAPYGWPQGSCDAQGRPLQGADNGMGNCFTGSCGAALAPYGGQQAGCPGSGPQCCGCNKPETVPTAFVPPPPSAPTIPAVTASVPPPPPPPPAPAAPGASKPVGNWGLAGEYAVSRSGITDPMVQQLLAGSCQRAQEILDQVGAN